MVSADRPVILFLPGMMCDERLFGPQINGLSATHDVIVARFDAGASIEAFARAALALVSKYRRIDLVGLSMGGIVAMECLRQAPDRVRRMVLMDTNPLAETPDRQELRVPQIQRALAGGLDRILIEEMKPLYLAPENRDNEELLILVLDMARQLGPNVFERQSRALAARSDSLATLRDWPHPACILYGEHDRLCSRELHELMHQTLGDSRLHVIPEAGHLPTLEASEAVSQVIEDFLTA